MIYGMLRNLTKRSASNAWTKLRPEICPVCKKQAWKTALADDIVKRGGRVLCVKCAMDVAWGE